MTRPPIIRADTIDLQDHTSPSAKDHTRQPAHPAPLGIGPAAPHQAAAIRHVSEERTAEQENLSQAWSNAQQLLQDEPASDGDLTTIDDTNGEHQFAQDEQAIRQNGGHTGAAEDNNMSEGEGEDGVDDDVMDKISSSPSIDDGGYSLSSTWPPRASSLTPVSTPTRQPLHAPDLDFDSSSPFTSTPLHLPLTVAQTRPGSLFATQSDASSPFTATPSHFPISVDHAEYDSSSEDHHRQCEYIHATKATDLELDEGYDDKAENKARDLLNVLKSEQAMDDIDEDLDLDSDVKAEDIYTLLLPEDDPLLRNSFNDIEPQAAKPPSPTDSNSSWETESDDGSMEESNHSDDDTDDISFSDDPRFVDSGWGGECLRDSEDIDFEFVYALHTFVATVEGQANATKGDTMVLLDDSNSYWWLVRVVKDSSIGYLPAEHIETPTERLARLNKHRNIDLSATMLGDTAEKSKNPLKKAMRRRNAKTVTFTAPTYVEASDYDFSSGEDNEEGESLENGAVSADESQQKSNVAQDDTATVAPLKVNGVKKEMILGSNDGNASSTDPNQEGRRKGVDQPRSSDEIFDKQFTSPGRVRNGVVRDTDSFFKDDNVETRKITLTPNLLRDDSSTSTGRSANGRQRSSSLEGPDKDLRSDKSKEDKRKKEKKQGMLGGLFKRKEKKTKTQEGKGAESDKHLDELGRSSPQSKDSDDSSTIERPVQADSKSAQSPQRVNSKGKLQKLPPREPSPPRTRSAAAETSNAAQQATSAQEPTANGATTTSTMRLADPKSDTAVESRAASSTRSPEPQVQDITNRSGKLSELTNRLRSPDQPRREKVKKAKQRVELDVDSSPEPQEPANPFEDPNEEDHDEQQQTQPVHTSEAAAAERLSESPVHISPVDDEPDADLSQPPALVGDTSSQEDQLVSPISPRSSPSLNDVDAPLVDPSPAAAAMSSAVHRSPEADSKPSPAPLATSATANPPADTSSTPTISPTLGRPPTRSPPAQPHTSPSLPQQQSARATARSPTTPTSTATTTTSSLPPWSDASLRAYLDDGSDVRDLLIVVHDVSGVVPVGPDHPLMAGLFEAERGAVKGMEARLDGLLGEWLERKRRERGRGVEVGNGGGGRKAL